MNRKTHTGWQRFFNGLALSVVTAALVTGCQDLNDIQHLDPLKGVVFKINYEPSPTTLQGLVVDARTGESLNSPVQIRIYGPDASRVVTYEGVSTTSIKSNNADLFLGLKGTVPSTAKPAELRIVAEAAGYISSSIYLFVDKAKPEPFSIRLVKDAAPPAGVTLSNGVVETSSTGAVRTNESITTPTSASMTTSATVQIAANTQLKDTRGQVVSGNLSAQIAAYSSLSELALRAYPGGFTTRLGVDDRGNKDVVGTFTPAGFVTIELENSNGQKVSNLSHPATVRVELNGDVLNPGTGQKLKAGDQIPVFRYNETNGEWTYERNAAVSQEGGKLQALISATYAAGYSLAFWTPSGTTCPGGAQWAITGKPDGKPVSWKLYNGNQLYKSGSTTENAINIQSPFSGAARLELYSPSGTMIGTATVSQLCGSHTATVTYPANLVDLDVAVTAYCENKTDVQISPSAWVRYRKVGTTNWQQAFLTAGKGKLVGLEANTDYEAGVDYNGFNAVTINSGQTSGSEMIKITLPKDMSVCQ